MGEGLKGCCGCHCKDKGKAATNAEKQAQTAEKARALAKQKLTEMDIKLGGTDQVNELANLKAALETCEDKWYNAGSADAKGSVEPIVYQAWKHEFEKG